MVGASEPPVESALAPDTQRAFNLNMDGQQLLALRGYIQLNLSPDARVHSRGLASGRLALKAATPQPCAMLGCKLFAASPSSLRACRLQQTLGLVHSACKLWAMPQGAAVRGSISGMRR
jgi:hypothetical protein